MMTEPDVRLLRDRAVVDFLQVVEIEEVSPAGVRIPIGAGQRYTTLRPERGGPLQIVGTVDRINAGGDPEREMWVISVPQRASLRTVLCAIGAGVLDVAEEFGDWLCPNWLYALLERRKGE